MLVENYSNSPPVWTVFIPGIFQRASGPTLEHLNEACASLPPGREAALASKRSRRRLRKNHSFCRDTWLALAARGKSVEFYGVRGSTQFQNWS